jgi:hypothetical protein
MYFRTVLILLFLMILSCQKEKLSKDVLAIGHAGMGVNVPISVFPPNSAEAFQLALHLGVEGLECDVRMDLNQELWCFHDETLDLTTNASGCVSEMKSEDLEKVYYKSGNSKLLKFSDLLSVLDTTKYLFIDLKHWNACENASESAQNFMNALFELGINLRPNTFLILSNPLWLTVFESDFNTLLDINPINLNELNIYEQHVHGWCVNTAKVGESWIAFWKLKGKLTVLTEMKAAKTIRSAILKNPFAVITDDVKSTLNLKKK